MTIVKHASVISHGLDKAATDAAINREYRTLIEQANEVIAQSRARLLRNRTVCYVIVELLCNCKGCYVIVEFVDANRISCYAFVDVIDANR